MWRRNDDAPSMRAMELKVWVDGVQRIVCGVTELTTCQEVVIALAQAIGESIHPAILSKTQGINSRDKLKIRLNYSELLYPF